MYRVLLHWAKGVLQAEFDIMRMRDHLHNCIENMELMPFPKLRRKLKLRKQTEKVLKYSITADCAVLCEFPNSYDDHKHLIEGGCRVVSTPIFFLKPPPPPPQKKKKKY